MSEVDVDTVIIGASAAGLAVAAQLRKRGRSFELLEAQQAVGDPWRQRYDRLHLHTPRWTSGLPGLPMPRRWGRYPSRDQVVEYLEMYRRRFDLHPRFGQAVRRVARSGDTWLTTTDGREWRSRHVVVATGRTRVPIRPTWPGMDDFAGDLLHSSEYRNGERWARRPVLVVGFGNSACEQALDLVERGAQAHLSVRSPVNVIPRDLLGIVPILQVGIALQRLPPRVADAIASPVVRLAVGDVRDVGLRKLPYGPITQIDRHGRVPLLDIGTMREIRAGRIDVHPGIERFTAEGVEFVDGTRLAVDAVVLATGFAAKVDDFLDDWEGVCDPEGTPLTSGGVGHDGLFFCGMWVSPAGMLREIGIEARQIAGVIAAAA